METVRLIENIGGRTASFQADLTDLGQIDSLVSQVNLTFGSSIDILINNACQPNRRDSLSMLTEELYTQTMDANFKSCVFLCKAVILAMIEKSGGSIVSIATAAGHTCEHQA